MAQFIDTRYRQKAESEPLNKRFKDITGPSVLRGFRLRKGSTNYSVSLVRDGFASSVCITPSGARVEETTDLIDILPIEPNSSGSGLPRIDSIYIEYTYGSSSQAIYKLVRGSDTAAPNPNPNTHLLLGYVYVYPSFQVLREGDLVSVPYGFSKLVVSGKSTFNGESEFNGPVIFKQPVQFLAGSTGGGEGGGTASFIDRFASPIKATAGQTTFKLTAPQQYTPGTKTLFVYKNGDLQPPSQYEEVDRETFRFYDPLKLGDEVWACWYNSLSIYKASDHNHDDLYYRKWEITNRMVRYVQDFFVGPAGKVINHYLGHQNYVVVSVVPTEKTSDVGQISVDKRNDSIIVYNSGGYRGGFDLTYQIKNANEPPTFESLGHYSVDSSDYDTAAGVYKKTVIKRPNKTIYAITNLHSPNAQNQYTRVDVSYYNQDGTKILETKMWALTYDTNGNIVSKTLT